jgi:hypothetical protein
MKNVLIKKCNEKRSCGGSKHKWEDNIMTDLEENVYEDVDWIHLSLWMGPMADLCTQSNEPLNFIKGEEYGQISNY